jgi:hypothetical protein
MKNKISNDMREIVKELTARLDSGIGTQDRQELIDSLFQEHLMQKEIIGSSIDPSLLARMKQAVEVEFLPLYDSYRDNTNRIKEIQKNRSIGKYVLGTVVALEAISAIATKGRSLKPQVLIPTALIEAGIGFIIYSGAQWFDDRKIDAERENMIRAVGKLEESLDVRASYRAYAAENSSNVAAIARSLTTSYKNPEKFWVDYSLVRKADPISEREIEGLGFNNFNDFLQSHIEGIGKDARDYRFNLLFFEAQKAFMDKDSKYAERILSKASGGKSK